MKNVFKDAFKEIARKLPHAFLIGLGVVELIDSIKNYIKAEEVEETESSEKTESEE